MDDHVVGAVQSQIRHLDCLDDRQAVNADMLRVELACDVPEPVLDLLEERSGGLADLRNAVR
jgi:hypothetical protein